MLGKYVQCIKADSNNVKSRETAGVVVNKDLKLLEPCNT